MAKERFEIKKGASGKTWVCDNERGVCQLFESEKKADSFVKQQKGKK